MLFTRDGRTTAQSYLDEFSLHTRIKQVARSIVLWLALVIAAFLLTACSTSSAVRITSTPQIVATRMMALLFGELVEVEGCLRVNVEGSSSYLLVWLPDFAVNVDGGAVQVTDEKGNQVVVHVGDRLRLVGGEVHSIELLSGQVRQNLPAHCPGPYWVVSSIEASE